MWSSSSGKPPQWFFGYFEESCGSSDNTAQGWAEITELLTVAGRYIPTLNPPGAVIENICEDCTDFLSHTSKRLVVPYSTCTNLCMCLGVSVYLHEQVSTVQCIGRVKQRGQWQLKAHWDSGLVLQRFPGWLDYSGKLTKGEQWREANLLIIVSNYLHTLSAHMDVCDHAYICSSVFIIRDSFNIIRAQLKHDAFKLRRVLSEGTFTEGPCSREILSN